MPSIQTPNSTLPPVLITALRRVLRPIIKLMLANGITYPSLLELLKELFVEIADKDFKIDGKSSTDSHLSLLTGVHRKDIKRLRHENHSDAETIPQAISLGARLVSLWTSDTRYLDENNQPKPLPRFIKEGGEISFEKLVANVSCDIRSRVVLDEWLRLGVAHFDDQKRVCLNTSAFVPANGFDEKVYYFGHNLHDHAAAATNNLLGEKQPFIERSVSYDELTFDSVQKLAEKSKHLGMESLLAINKDAMEYEKNDASGSESRYRMTFGIYFYSEPAELEELPKKDNDLTHN
ncbi:DUF6502 family protein [Nitrosomonas supralitoralis]|uniref:Uncharacterized protein n=1 Tax=Nitrosomonas supralitoralis TaxID=2116706 RepID=A0A2P7NUI5_9PROT|nr:DUF6502 family protein [Nitrosomonas supralitoralis]PSJ17095.1 hypothetical protein C7H79_09770 [Nitrosomonas supralitoralis]